SIMIACRSPPALLPPSIGVSVPNGYGPLSLSLAYWKWTCTLGWESPTTVYGIPYGNPPEGPKSGWRSVLPAFMVFSHWALCLSTGRCEMSACQTLFAGKTRQFGAPGGTAPEEAGASQAARPTPHATSTAPTLRILRQVSAKA